MKSKIIAIICLVALLILIGFAVAQFEGMSDSPESAQNPLMYQNETYGYSVDLSSGLVAQEYQPAYVSIGTSTGEIDGISGFNSIADIAVVTDDLVRGMTNMCAADGPSESISCTGISRQSLFDADNGITGVEYYLSEQTSNLRTGTSSISEKGPLYAFNISANVPDASSAYVVIHAPIATPADEVDAARIERIAQSIRLYRVETR